MPSAPKLPDELRDELPEGLPDATARAGRVRVPHPGERTPPAVPAHQRTPGPARCWRPTPLLAASAALHGAALVTAAAVPGWIPAVAAVLLADHVAVTAAGLWPRSTLLGPNLRRLPGAGGTGARRRVALTFDDGPDPEVTPRVLDVLERHGARASFFCVGARVAACPELTAEIARRGHRVENHSQRHLRRFSVLGPGEQAREVDRAQEAIAAATGRAPRLFRPPAGFRNALLEPILARRGLWLASWTRRGFDTVRRNPTRVLDALTPGPDRPRGEILVLHDGGCARGPEGRPVVLEVLPRLLERLARAGLQPVPLEPPEARPAHE